MSECAGNVGNAGALARLIASRLRHSLTLSLLMVGVASAQSPATAPAAPTAAATPGTIERVAVPVAAPVASPVAPPVAATASQPPAGPAKAATAKASTPTESAKPTPIALILPLNSKSLGPAADALRQGFFAAVVADGAGALAHKVIAVDDDGHALAAAYRAAARDGAIAVVSGLTRDGANVTARESGHLPTLALNTPTTDIGSGPDAPPNFYQISLNVDAEVRALAQQARADGLQKVVLVHTPSVTSRRVQETFENEWTRMGGEIALRIPFTNDPADAEKIRRAFDRLTREAHGETGTSLDKPLRAPKTEKGEKPERPDFQGADMIFIAADIAAARFARPYFPQGVPVFSSSSALDARAGAVQNIDLDAVKFLEMPWFVLPDHPAVMTYAKPAVELPIDYERLYALGIDAWRIINALLKAKPPTRPGAPIVFESMDGVTGRIRLEGNQFQRSLTLIEMRDGRPQPIGSPEQ